MNRFGTHFALLGLIALLLALAGLWFVQSRPSTLPVGQIAEKVTVPAPAEPAIETGDSGQHTDEKTVLDALVFSNDRSNLAKKPPQLAKDEADARSFTEEELADRTEFETQVEHAIAGDTAQTLELSQFINDCVKRFPSSDVVKRSIEFASRRLADGRPLPKRLVSWPEQSIETLEAFEQFQWASFKTCESTRDLVNEGFWQRLIRQADGGNPQARYLYSTLQRFPLEAGLNFERWDEVLEHNERVTEYTWRNMQEREPLGILAMSQTLPSNNRSPYNRFNTEAVLTTAALKCGLQSDYLSQQVEQWVSHFERMQTTYPDALARLNEASDEVKQMFCK